MAGPEGRVTAGNPKRFRMLVALSVLGAAVWFLLDALEDTIERAERESARMMLNQVRSALVVRAAEAMLVRDEQLEELNGLNPLLLLSSGQQWPECHELNRDDRGWCYASEQQWLVYQPGQMLELDGRRGKPGDPFVWQVQVNYAGNVKNRQNREERAVGLKLVEINGQRVSETQ